MHTLNNKTKETLKHRLGRNYDELMEMSAEDLDALIEKRIGKKLRPAFTLKSMVNRGSVYLFFKRLISQNTIDRQIARI